MVPTPVPANSLHNMGTPGINSEDSSSDGFSLVDDGKSLVDNGGSFMDSDAYGDGESEDETAATPANGVAGLDLSGSEDAMTSQEDRAVCRGKLVALAMLAAATTAISAFLYLSARGSEEDDFSNTFESQASSFENSLQSQLVGTVVHLGSIGTAITSDSKTYPWPNITIPDFDQRVSKILNGKEYESVLLVPKVSRETRRGWEAYAQETRNLGWCTGCSVAQQIFVFGDNQNNQKVFVNDNATGPFLPVWQNSPVNGDIINYDLASHPGLTRCLEAVLDTAKPMLTETLLEDSFIGKATHPHILILQPLPQDFDGTNPDVVALLVTVSTWEQIFGAMSFKTSSKIVAVLENTCGQFISFQIEGEQVNFLGLTDMHDPTYTSMKYSFPLTDADADADFITACEDNLSLYPTQSMEDEFLTNSPIYYFLLPVVLSLIFLGGMLFYNRMVRRRQEELTKEVTRSRKIVSSLFPAMVHDRLFHEGQPVEQSPSGEQQQQQQQQQTTIANMDAVEETFNKSIGSLSAAEPPKSNGALSSEVESPPQVERRSSSRSNRGDQPMQRLRSFLSDLPAQSEHSNPIAEPKEEPIADLFPDVTVMFADISGFTAWSSSREPAQVFKLLETIYRSFDRIARKRAVFKVETIGDCYVAVTGLPDPQDDHAVIMARFAKECMQKMSELTKKLEVTLGPDTGDLCMRFGLHSGPVTAGVLRGEKSRFQLFGDTVNFASRMESTGQRNRIQASQATADLLIAAGKKSWVHPRDELVNAKGKGHVQTFWIVPKQSSGSHKSVYDSESGGGRKTERHDSQINLKSKRKGASLLRDGSNHKPRSADIERGSSSRRSLLSISQHSQIWSADNKIDIDDDYDGFDDANRQERLINWNVEILTGVIKRIVAYRQARGSSDDGGEGLEIEKYPGQQALGEITEIIPSVIDQPAATNTEVDPESILLPLKAEKQLREYVTMVACMYRDNFFHNFEHASHVLMSAQKLMKRVILADQQKFVDSSDLSNDYTSGIASDPLIQFAIVFSALIHDVDHTGVPNSQLVKEQAHIATLYKNKSIAEQNSLDLAWDLLMDRKYRDLQRCVFSSTAELKRFRKLVVNVVLATDIFDPDMKSLRNSRWDKAFRKESLDLPLSEEDDRNLKSTIVIEYIMQASDVSHTMQHWHVYQRWNERLFEEMYSAYQVKRGDKDPSIDWYKGELWFFDNYVIPLAKKLKECQVFGVSSDECLNYALENRKEWEMKGKDIIQSFVDKHTSTTTTPEK